MSIVAVQFEDGSSLVSNSGTARQHNYTRVKDLGTARRFYERLGWSCSNASKEGIVFFQCPGIALALYPRHELAADAKIEPDGAGFGGFTLAYNVRSREQVDAVLDQAVNAGAKLLKPAQEAFWGGYSGYFCDPDGFAWEVAWNPFFEIATDGSLRLPD